MALRIEIGATWKKGKFKFREGDVDGGEDWIMFTKKEILEHISELIDELKWKK